MSYLLSVFTGLKYLGRRHDDDFTDQLHYRITSNVLICLAILVSFKQFGGRPMECALPDYMPSSWEQYAENFCWSQDTYYLSIDQNLDMNNEDLRNARISYYQWMPFFLLISAFSFQVPMQVWGFITSGTGIRLEDLVEQALDPKTISLEARQQTIRTMATYLENALRFQRRLDKQKMVPHNVLRFLNFPYKPFFMTWMYLLVKLLYMANIVVQFCIMNYFLQTDDKDGWYGWNALGHLLNGTQWSTSGFFPRSTLCDFHMRMLGRPHRHSIQCTLTINLFTEKIFIFLWFWYHIVALLTALSFVYWLIVCMPPFFPSAFVMRHLELAEMPFDPSDSLSDVRRFVKKYLRTDGVFILRIINMHAGVIFGSELVAAMFKSYIGIEKLIKAKDNKSKWSEREIKHMLKGEKHHPPPVFEAGFDQPDTAPVFAPTMPPIEETKLLKEVKITRRNSMAEEDRIEELLKSERRDSPFGLSTPTMKKRSPDVEKS